MTYGVHNDFFSPLVISAYVVMYMQLYSLCHVVHQHAFECNYMMIGVGYIVITRVRGEDIL